MDNVSESEIPSESENVANPNENLETESNSESNVEPQSLVDVSNKEDEPGRSRGGRSRRCGGCSCGGRSRGGRSLSRGCGQRRKFESSKGTEVGKGKAKTGGESAKKKPTDGNPEWKSVSADTDFVNSNAEIEFLEYSGPSRSAKIPETPLQFLQLFFTDDIFDMLAEQDQFNFRETKHPRARCCVCGNRKNPKTRKWKDKKTTDYCRKCKKHVCEECFEDFHTKSFIM